MAEAKEDSANTPATSMSSRSIPLRYRVIAAAWFAGAATIAAVLLTQTVLKSLFIPVDVFAFLITGIVFAAISAFFLGGGLVDDRIVTTKAKAAQIGLNITLISYAVSSAGPLFVLQLFKIRSVADFTQYQPFHINFKRSMSKQD
jgi:hypothetical protein